MVHTEDSISGEKEICVWLEIVANDMIGKSKSLKGTLPPKQETKCSEVCGGAF